MNTPWGQADYSEQVAEGITFHSTPSHGGYLLSEERVAQVEDRYRAFACKWNKWNDDRWYEEDCAALAVVVTFPECFPQVTKADLERYTQLLEGWVSNG